MAQQLAFLSTGPDLSDYVHNIHQSFNKITWKRYDHYCFIWWDVESSGYGHYIHMLIAGRKRGKHCEMLCETGRECVVKQREGENNHTRQLSMIRVTLIYNGYYIRLNIRHSTSDLIHIRKIDFFFLFIFFAILTGSKLLYGFQGIKRLNVQCNIIMNILSIF